MLNISSVDEQALSEDDRAKIHKLTVRLYSVVTYRHRFAAALRLCDKLNSDLAENSRQVEESQALRTTDPSSYSRTFTALMDKGADIQHMIGVTYRDAIMTVFHLDKLLVKGVQAAVREVNFLNSRLDAKKIKASREPFLKKFPNAEALRNAIAHSAEQLMGRENSGYIESLLNREFTTSAKGKTFTFTLNSESLDAIDQSIAKLRYALNLYPGVPHYDDLATSPLWK